MSSFYGNMKNNSRASFIFDKIYPTRTAMEDALNAVDNDNNPIGDGIFVNRYVLVDYHYALADPIVNQDNIEKYYIEVDNNIITIQNFQTYYIKSIDNGYINFIHPTTFSKEPDIVYYQKRLFIDKYETTGILYTDRFEENNSINNGENINITNELKETDLYYAHRYTDWRNYKACYDSTVWMKIYVDGQERYIMVAELDAKAPILEFIDDAPSCLNGSGHFDQRASTDLNYVYFIPKNWDLIVNQHNPDLNYVNENSNDYWYYQSNKNSNPIWYENYILTTDTQAQKNKKYYQIQFERINNLTIGTSIKNLHYYNKVNNKYIATEDLVVQQENINNYYKIKKITEQIKNINDNVNGLYELNIQKKTYNDQVEYPYFNMAGFDSRVSNHADPRGQGIFIKPVQSAQTYPKHKFTHAGILTKDSYLPNRYFTYHGTKKRIENPNDFLFNQDCAYYIGTSENNCQLISLILNNNNEYKPARELDENQYQYYFYDEDLTNINYFTKSTEWHQNEAYYEITTELDINGNKLTAHEDDTYRLDIYLPEFGNTVADIYDIIYGTPVIQQNKNDGYNNLIGYCSKEQWLTYYNKQEDNGDYWSSNIKFNLSTEEFHELSPELYPGVYDIPVYLRTGSNVRPYDLKRINSRLAIPYNNLETDNISIGWSLSVLKRYLSELRHLAYAKDELGNQIGLQSDWTQDNNSLIGYIQNKPIIITNYKKTKDTIVVPVPDPEHPLEVIPKKYYKETVQNGEIVYEELSMQIGDSLTNLNYVVYELPYTYNQNKKQRKYIQCDNSNEFIEGKQYYIRAGSEWREATYTQYSNSNIEPVQASAQLNGQVQYDYGYQVTVNNNHEVIQRRYTCKAQSLFQGNTGINNNITLYYKENEQNGKSVKTFSIITKKRNGINEEALEIHDILESFRTLSQSEINTMLNTTLVNNNYGCEFIIDESYDTNVWPEDQDVNRIQGFYYASLIMNYINYPLDEEHFLQNPSNYYYIDEIPIAQKDYEIHEIWNNILESVVNHEP